MVELKQLAVAEDFPHIIQGNAGGAIGTDSSGVPVTALTRIGRDFNQKAARV